MKQTMTLSLIAAILFVAAPVGSSHPASECYPSSHPGEEETITCISDSAVMPETPVAPEQTVPGGNSDWMDRTFVHHSLGMRFTATWCGWCPYMNESFVKAKRKLGNRMEYVNLHAASSDLAFDGTAILASQFQITGYPTGIVDGKTKISNTTDTDYTGDRIVAAVSETETNYPPMTAIAMESSLSGRTVTVKVDVYLKQSEDYKVSGLLLEDGIVARQNGGSNDYVHDRVARIALTPITGSAFTAIAGDVKHFTWTVTVPDGCDTDNLSVLVWIQRKFGNQPVLQSEDYGDYYIDNCRQAPVGTIALLETQ